MRTRRIARSNSSPRLVQTLAGAEATPSEIKEGKSKEEKGMKESGREEERNV